MPNGNYFGNLQVVEDVDDIITHGLHFVLACIVGCAGLSIAQKVRNYNTVTSLREVCDLGRPTTMRRGEAMEKEQSRFAFC